MRRFIIEPEGWPCSYAECRPGLFLFGDSLCMMTEYGSEGHMDAYCESGEAFWGGVNTRKERDALIVQPVVAVWEEVEDE